MRLTVTPIGSIGSTAASVAEAVVSYLEGLRGDPGAALLAGGLSGPTAYYADSIEGPGRWLGAGAALQSLTGRVDRDSFQRVLEGRHPRTGARLVTARGSAQRDHLATGTAACFDAQGDALYGVSDVARLLSLRRQDVEELIAAGAAGPGDAADLGWIASVDTPSGPLVPDREITRHLDVMSGPVDATSVRADGDVNDLLTVRQVAQVLHVTPRYVQRLCAAYHDEPDRRRRSVLPNQRVGDGAVTRYRVRRGDVGRFAETRRPPVARVGFDLTLTCEKSLGVLSMLADPAHQPTLLRALRVANDTAIAHLDTVAAVARRRGRAVDTEGLVVATYFHATSRALDPHPHHHNVVANAVVDADGAVRTLDARALYRHAPAAAALATAAARWELRGLGLGWWRRDNGVWEVAGIAEGAITEFSRRRNEMDEVRAALEERLGRRISHAEEDTVAVSTRAAKQAVDASALLDDWRRRATAVGLDVRDCFDRRGDRALPHDVLPDRLVAQLFDDLANPSAGLCAESTTFDRGDVLAAIADWSVTDTAGGVRKVLLPPVEIERLADRFCASDLIVELDPARVGGVIRRRDGTTVADGQHNPVFSTIELLEVEAEIERIWRQAGHGGAVVPAPSVLAAAVFSADVALSADQQALVQAWCTSGRRMQCAVGGAGTGKTITMRAVADAWRASGYRVIGCAVKGEAARQLAVDAGIESDTVALLLTRARGGHTVIDSRTVVIVDEASTLGDRDLLELLRVADTANATVRLIGDPAQHGSVPAGGSFAQLVAEEPTSTPKLTTMRRLLDTGERHRADLVRAGRIGEALTELTTSGQLVLSNSDAETYAAMLDRWYQHRHNGKPHPMVHGRNRQRQLLNRLAQTVLAADGHIDLACAVTTRDGRRLAVGDEVIARHGDRRIHPPGNPAAWMRNGTTGRITAIHAGAEPADDRITISTVDGPVECGRHVFDHRRGGIDLAYAVTSYAVEGSTRAASTSAITATTARSELYVDITRGRTSNQLYATRQISDTDAENHLPRVDADLLAALRQRLAHGTARTALGIDPSAIQVAKTRAGRSLRGLRAAIRRGEQGPLDAAISRTIAAIRRQARTAPPTALSAILPPRPARPHLAKRWDNAAAAVAVYHAEHGPRARGSSTDERPIERVLGPRPAGAAGEHWDQLAARLTHFAAELSIRTLNDADPTRHLSPVASNDRLTHDLERLAADGHLATIDLADLQQLVADITGWYSDHDPGADTATPPCNQPAVPTDEDRYNQLVRLFQNVDLHPPAGRGIA